MGDTFYDSICEITQAVQDRERIPATDDASRAFLMDAKRQIKKAAEGGFTFATWDVEEPDYLEEVAKILEGIGFTVERGSGALTARWRSGKPATA